MFTDSRYPGPVRGQTRQMLLYTQLFGLTSDTPSAPAGFAIRFQEVPYVSHRTFEGGLGEEFALAGDRPGRLPNWTGSDSPGSPRRPLPRRSSSTNRGSS